MSHRSADGIPIEEAPFWVPLIATPLIGAVLFLGAVGFQDTLGLWHGQWKLTALGALAASAILIATLPPAARNPESRTPDPASSASPPGSSERQPSPSS